MVWISGLSFKEDKLIEKYASRFGGFRKNRWYIDYLLEFENFTKELKKLVDRKL